MFTDFRLGKVANLLQPIAALCEEFATIARTISCMGHRLYRGDGCPVCGDRLELRYGWSILSPLRLRKHLRCLSCDFVAVTRRDHMRGQPLASEPRMGNNF